MPVSRLIANRSRIAQASDATPLCRYWHRRWFSRGSDGMRALLTAFPRFADIIYNHCQPTAYGSWGRNVYSWPVASVSHEIWERARSPFACQIAEEESSLGVATVLRAPLKRIYRWWTDGGLSLIIKARNETRDESPYLAGLYLMRGMAVILIRNAHDWHLFHNKRYNSSRCHLIKSVLTGEIFNILYS